LISTVHWHRSLWLVSGLLLVGWATWWCARATGQAGGGGIPLRNVTVHVDILEIEWSGERGRKYDVLTAPTDRGPWTRLNYSPLAVHEFKCVLPAVDKRAFCQVVENSVRANDAMSGTEASSGVFQIAQNLGRAAYRADTGAISPQ
jgi:hypothetical protein